MHSSSIHVLILGSVWPEPNASAAGVRAEALVRIFRSQGWRVTYASIARPSPHQEHLHGLGAETATIAANDPGFDKWIRSQCPDIVVFDRFIMEEQFGWRVRAQCPSALRVLNTEDLHSLRRSREAALKAGMSIEDISQCRFELLTEDCQRELASIYRSDLTWLVSDFEERLLRERLGVPSELLRVYPYFADPASEAPRGFSEREHFVMIGNFRHPPNADGVRWLRQEIWPRIRARLPQAQAHIYGAYPPRELQALDSPREGFLMRGWAEDARSTLSRYRVNLAPLRFGAGIKGKIIEGWAVGTPVVTTSIGAEGLLPAEDLPPRETVRFAGCIADSTDELAEKSVELYANEPLWIQTQTVAMETVDRTLGFESNSSRLVADLLRARAETASIRKRNVVGAILWHQSLRATEYFSRWIEAKNAATARSERP